MRRRDFLKTGAAAGLVLGFHIPGRSATAAPARVNAWVRIAPDNTVTLMIHKGEMGQGTVTSLSQILADELDIEWSQIRTEFPPIDPAFGMQGVVGSQSIRTGWDPLRRAGAAARQMLAQAGAKRWSVAETEVRAANGFVTNTASGAKFTYGELAEDAAKLQAPSRPKLKDPSEFRYIGKSMKRLDTRDKVAGRTRFGIDVRVPGMVYAAVARPPVVRGKVISFDATRARAIPGVKDFVKVPSGVAHAVFSGPAVDRLKNSRISEVVVTNTLPLSEEKRFDKLTELSIAPLIARAIREVFDDGSVTSLFDGNA